MSQPSVHLPPTTAAGNGIAGAKGGQTSEHGQKPKDEDYHRSDYEVDAHKLWLDQRVRAIEERDKLQEMQEDLEEQAWRMRRDEEDRRRDEEKRQRSERSVYLRRRRELEKQRLLYLADVEATGLLRPDSKVGLDLTLPDLPVAEAKVIVSSSVLPDVDDSIKDISMAMTDSSLITVSSYNKPITATTVAHANVGLTSAPTGSSAAMNTKQAPAQTSQKVQSQGDATTPTARDVTQDSSDQGASTRSRQAASAPLNPAATSFRPQQASF